MADTSFLDGLKLVGSIVGLITGCFVLIDRIIRARPVVWVGAEKLGVNAYPVLSIRNTDSAPIFVRGVDFSTGRYAVAHTTSLNAIVRAASGARLDAFVEQDQAVSFPLISEGDGELLDDAVCKIKVTWRRASSPELWQYPVVLRIRPSRIQEIAVGVRQMED